MSKHTKGPWYQEKAYGEEGHYIVGSDTSTICNMSYKNGTWFDNGQANARLIVTACNNHHKMYEALKEAARWYDLIAQNYPEMVSLKSALKMAHDIVAEIEGADHA